MPRQTRVFSWHDGPVITGEQLAEARSRAGLSQKELAQLLRHGERTIQKWEKEGVHPAKEALVRARLGNFLATEGEPQPLATYSDWALLMEIGRRLEARAAKPADSDVDMDTHKRGRGASKIGDQT
jgi:transcriptional regulator with XRE-family HTH domain